MMPPLRWTRERKHSQSPVGADIGTVMEPACSSGSRSLLTFQRNACITPEGPAAIFRWMPGSSPGMTNGEKLGPGSAAHHGACTRAARSADPGVLRRARETRSVVEEDSAASLTYSDASASAAPSLRSAGCALGSPRTAGRLLPACGRCSCRCRSACADAFFARGE